MTTFLLLFYIPVILAIYAVITRYQQINPVWIVLLIISLFTGAGPIVALLFLAVNKKMLQGQTPPTATAPQAPSVQSTVMVYPEPTAGNLASPIPQTVSSGFTPQQKAAGTVLGSVVGVILWISGLIAVGFFVIVTIAIIQCANDPKCM